MKKILVIEDDKNIREAICEILSLNNFEVVEAKNGREGVLKALSEPPDAILSDVMMPEMDGFEVLKNIRNNKITENIPFILLTAKVERIDQRLGMTLGADDYITKPFSSKELINTLNTRLERAEKIHQEISTKVKKLIKDMNDVSVHEFNTPLNGLLGSIDFISSKLEKSNNQSFKELFEVMKTSGKRLKRVIDNIYIYKQIVMSDSIETKSIYVGGMCSLEKDVIEVVLQRFAKKYNRANDLEFDIQNALISLKSEVLMIILEELIDNAFKFSTSGSIVKMKGFKKNNFYHLIFSDQGVGFSEEDIKSIAPFVQFERKKLAQQGSGLGLFIAKRLTELNGGNFAIRPGGEGGSEVEVVLPAFSFENV